LRGFTGQWGVVGLLCLVTYVLLRVVFDIPFAPTMIAVLILSIAGTLLFSPAREPLERPASQRGGDSAAPRRDEPFLLLPEDLVLNRGVSGFGAVPGESVGGRRFPRVPLEPGEQLVAAVSGGRAGGPLRASLGYITLTDRRLIFTGEHPLIDLAVVLPFLRNVRLLSLPYAEIESIRLQRRRNYGMLLGSMRPAVIIRTHAGREHTFWPNVFDLEAFVRRIEELRAR
jgi:hypothetical protein